MEPRFDKNIDALLRQPHLRRGVLLGDADHLDSDQIAAFAANAVPDSARPTYFAHLADCSECRGSLAAVITLSAEDESVAAEAAPLPALATEVEKEPWYRGLFRAPGLAFGMGALVLLFSGFIGYMVLQNAGGDTAAIQMANMPSGETARGPMAEAPESETYVSNTAVSNTAARANANSNTAADSGSGGGGGVPASRNSAGSRTDQEVAAEMKDRDVAMAVPAPPPPKPATEAEPTDAADARDEQRENAISARQMQELPAPMRAPALSNTAPVGEGRARTEAQATEKNKTQAQRVAGPPAKRLEGGKTFDLRGNVWYDSAYGGQSVTEVRRSTPAYRSLDSGLRAITDKIPGTVVIVWKEKAYRIR